MRHEDLIRSLSRQSALLRGSVLLTPVDNWPLLGDERNAASSLHGLYATDKQRPVHVQRNSDILFGGRRRVTNDLTRIYQDLARKLGGTDASMRLLSGLHAHTVVLMSIAKYGDRIMSVPVFAGGHMSTASIAHRLGLQVVHMPVDAERMCIDHTRTRDLVMSFKPNIILVDRSEGLKYEDFDLLGEFEGVVKIFDASQYLPQIMCGRYTNPFDWGFDLQLFSTHKSFPGPQKAGIVGRTSGEVWDRCLKGLGTYVSSHHPESTYVFGLVLSGDDTLNMYTSRMLRSADALERALLRANVPVVLAGAQGDPAWERTQHVWIRTKQQGDAFRLWNDLSRCRIHSNFRKLPYGLGWGLRLGIAHAASMGLCETSASMLGEIIGDVFHNGFSLIQRHQVRSIAEALTPLPFEQHTKGCCYD